MKITFLDGYTLNPGDLNWGVLEQLGEFEVYDRTPPELMTERALQADIVLVNKANLSRAVIESLPNLKYIGVTATGYNNVDIESARERGITVCNVRNYGANSVAQHTFALLLALTNRIETHSNAVANGEWVNAEDWCFRKSPLVELAGKTMGLVGLGDIATHVAEIAQAMGMNVIAFRKNRNLPAPANVSYVGLDDLFSNSDVVSLHCPLTADTSELINQNTLSKMKSEAYLINTGRGGLINESALAEALNSGQLAGAGLDVLSTEPPKADNPLLSAKNCVVTPHVAWATFEARKRLLDLAAQNIAGFLDGSPQNVVV